MSKAIDVLLERGANAAIILAAAVCIASWLWVSRAPASSRYSVGDSLAEISELATLPESRVLVVFVNSLCQYCTQSMAFYSRLTVELEKLRSSTAPGLVFVSLEPAETLAAYLASHGLLDRRNIALPSGTRFRMTSTPAILLLDRDRTVEKVWIGRLTAVQEAEVQAALQ